MYSLYLLFRSSVNLIPKCRIVSTVALLKFKQRNTNFCAQIDNSDIRFACRFLLVPLSQFGTSDDVGICTAEASSTSPDFSMRTTTLPDALLSSRILLLSSSFSAELSPSVSSISLNCLHSSRQPRSETTRPPLWSSASSDGAAPTRGRPSPRSARRRSSRRSGTTTAHSRVARGSSRPAYLNPHPHLAHVYHERFLFLEVCYARQLQRRQARQTHSRRNREPRRSLRQLRHHGDEFSSEYKKNSF